MCFIGKVNSRWLSVLTRAAVFFIAIYHERDKQLVLQTANFQTGQYTRIFRPRQDFFLLQRMPIFSSKTGYRLDDD